MNPFFSSSGTRIGRMFTAVTIVAASFLTGCATPSPNYSNQLTFNAPETAAKSLIGAVQVGDAAQIESILGSKAHEVLSSGDPVADRLNRQVFVTAIDQGWVLERIDGSTRELIIGHEQWPFPIPLVKDSHGWWFDTLAGMDEILARRIGRNELAAIGALTAYVLAQREYAAESHDGQAAGSFAQKLRSDPGMQNGLYWPAEGNVGRPSPLGQFVAAAAADGYGTQAAGVQAPYRGYYYRILTRQGPNAIGGERDYVSNSRMTDGFAMIAYPAEYRNSGVMSFIVAADGLLYEADLGENTLSTATGITAFDPDDRWMLVE